MLIYNFFKKYIELSLLYTLKYEKRVKMTCSLEQRTMLVCAWTQNLIGPVHWAITYSLTSKNKILNYSYLYL